MDLGSRRNICLETGFVSVQMLNRRKREAEDCQHTSCFISHLDGLAGEIWEDEFSLMISCWFTCSPSVFVVLAQRDRLEHCCPLPFPELLVIGTSEERNRAILKY